MEEVIGESTARVIEAYSSFMAGLPPFASSFISLFLLVLLIVAYIIFIWKLYTFMGTKNIFGLNLTKYNKTSRPFLSKLLAGLLYFLEYIIILPFVIFFWFSVFAIFLILLSNLEISSILIISTAIITAVRMISFYKGILAKELAKLLPFTLLAVSILNPTFFNVERIISQFSKIPTLFGNVIYYLAFILIIELLLRFFDFIFSLFGIEEEEV